MKILIPSLGREDRQITYDYLPDRWKDKAYFVVDWDEEGFKNSQVIRTPKEVSGIARLRHYLLCIHHNEKIFMMDDDLHFHKRDEGKLIKAVPDDIGNALDMMEEWLEEIPCVGFTSRFGNNWVKTDYVECHRPCMAYGLDVPVVMENNIRFDKFEVCEDYHLFLSLLRLGYKNRMTAQYTVTSPSVNKNGGCSVYRTKEMVEKSMKEFVKFHSPYASFRKTKGDTQGFDIGTELRVNWKKAFKDGSAISKSNLFK